MSYACLGAYSLSEWSDNTTKYGGPTWRGGYWFWDGAGILSYGVCVPFGERGNACTKWAIKDLLPPVKVPPYMEDQSVSVPLAQDEINRARQWIINPQLRNVGKPVLPSTGPLDGKVYFGAKLVDERRVAMPYDQAKIIAQIIAWCEYNKIEPVDPSAADLIQVPSIDDLKSSLNIQTTPDEDSDPNTKPFWENQWLLIGTIAFAVVVMAKNRRQPKKRKS